MPTESWEEASRARGDGVIHMKKLIPYYSYADERAAVMTDRKFCSILRGELIRSKTLFSDAVDWMYKTNTNSRYFERLKDDFDILLDEIEIKQNRWDERIPVEFLEKIIGYDWDLIQKAWKLEKDLEILMECLQEVSRQKADSKTRSKVKISMDVVDEKVDDITRMFKERETAFEINRIGLRDTFERIRERIRRSV